MHPFFGKWIAKHLASALIFYLHRVGRRDPSRLEPNENMKVSPEFLRAFVLSARGKGWTFVSVDHLWSELVAGRQPRRKIALTFDDGYLDNMTVGYPVLRELGVPFCIYVTTGLVSGQTRMWWMEIEDILLDQREIHGPSNELVPCATHDEKTNAFFYLREQFMSEDPAVSNKAFAWLESYLPQTEAGQQSGGKAYALSWADIRELLNDELVTIGAHTVSHPVLSALEPQRMEEEIRVSREVIEKQTGHAVEHFAYPFGTRQDAGEREFAACSAQGFKTAMTTRPGFVDSRHRQQLTALPRFMLSESFQFGHIGSLYADAVMCAVRERCHFSSFR
jgi:peptidoglycan/xylan/chitin deacetylase (PgdA/CDA1 family)